MYRIVLRAADTRAGHCWRFAGWWQALGTIVSHRKIVQYHGNLASYPQHMIYID
jgi:hypothetical protein